jgi:Type II secretion system (T2SS), protein E, N-terminal domain
MQDLLSRLQSANRQPRVQHRIPLGLLMLSRGQITARQLKQTLAAQKASENGRFGSWLLKLGFSTEQQITAALGRQWSCPVVSDSISLQVTWLSLIPLAMEESFHMVPVHYVENTKVLHVACADEIDYTMLYAVQRSLSYRTMPCLATASLLREALERARSIPRPSDLIFETCTDKLEISRITANYVSRSRADHVRVVSCAGYVWARLECRSGAINLLFHNRHHERRCALSG